MLQGEKRCLKTGKTCEAGSEGNSNFNFLYKMKKIDKMTLSQLAKKELTKRQQGLIKGGRYNCTCGCCYADSEGSSVEDNSNANCDGHQTTYCEKTVVYWGAC